MRIVNDILKYYIKNENIKSMRKTKEEQNFLNSF